ncbi:putative membrane protein [Nocardia nova SH22a]|uniref:Putative membrane protein n=1 Tax=Nocardia nova SH22a TaxID=1415166 RepID=W5TN48_9NOCA|nr:hypothetical protein [Nocardia nova]AHH20692.1 putative membrane protein [Nocardia nova SH22a]
MESAAPASNATGPLASVVRVARFTRVRYETHHLLYAVLFVAAVEGTAAVVSHPDAPWRAGWATAVRVVVVAVLLLYLRMVDEIKDLDHDRIHHPDRPLVTGAVAVGELWVTIAVVAVGLTVVSALLSWWSAVLVVAAMAYGLGLWALEAVSAPVRDNLLLNLVVTYPVQLWIIAYIVVSAVDTGQVESDWGTAAVAVIFAGAFLYFEFARKTVHGARPGQWYYSNVLGSTGSALTTGLFAIIAVAADLLLVRPGDHPMPWALLLWIPVPLLAVPLAGVWTFLRAATRTGAVPPVATAVPSGPLGPGEAGELRGPSVSGDADAASGPAVPEDSAAPEFPVVPAVVFVLVLYAILIAQALTWR